MIFGPETPPAPKPFWLQPGDAAPWFIARSPVNPSFSFNTAAGHTIVLAFIGSAGEPKSGAFLRALTRIRNRFDDANTLLFFVSSDPADESLPRLGNAPPGIRVFWDFDHAVARAYGLIPDDSPDGKLTMARAVFVLNPRLQITHIIPMDDADRTVQALSDALDDNKPFAAEHPAERQAPVLLVPNIFEPAFCERLVERYMTQGASDSGFMRQVDGKTVGVIDHSFKSRADHMIEDEALKTEIRARVFRRLVPEIRRAYQWQATRMERYLLAGYAAETKGFFRPHRDNTTAGTAHRRFAVSINLNHDYDGGVLTFPEYGRQLYKPAPGEACVFSCSMLHEVRPVTRGLRLVFVPFLYDEGDAAIREKNAHTIVDASVPDKDEAAPKVD